MNEVVFDSLSVQVEEGIVTQWFLEEGDPVNEGDELVELNTSSGTIVIEAKTSGILAEVYFDEGETVNKGEILCAIDDEEGEIFDGEEALDDDGDEEEDEEEKEKE